MINNTAVKATLTALVVSVMALTACNSTGFFNPSFVNTVQGGVTPVAPGPGAAFVFVRTVNETDQVLQFFVTVERRQIVRDEQGNIQRDDQGEILTEDVTESVLLPTVPGGDSNELGTLFECRNSAVIRVGLGQNLLPTDPAVFVIDPDNYDPEDPLGAQPGFGVLAEGINPLELFSGNFNCGDTIIFRAFRSSGLAGGIRLESFLLPGSEQGTNFSGPNTFVNFETFLESQVREDEVP